MRSLKKLWTDNRGIEGLPIRLVIALVVGVASLAIMTSILGGLPTFESTEVTTEYTNNDGVASLGASDPSISVEVSSDKGETLENGRIIISSGTADLSNGPATKEVSASGTSFSVGDEGSSADLQVDLRSDQNKGTLKVEVKPPSDGSYVDDQDNPTILITE